MKITRTTLCKVELLQRPQRACRNSKAVCRLAPTRDWGLSLYLAFWASPSRSTSRPA